MLCPCVLFLVMAKANLIRYWVHLYSNGNSVSDEMARSSLLVPLAMIILRQFGIIHVTTPTVPFIAELRGIQTPPMDEGGSHLEWQPV